LYPLVLHSKKTVTPEGVRDAFVVIENGIISDVLSELPENIIYPVTEIGDKVLMPGVIDPHVHINEPGRTEWEGFDTATKAAITGGVTTVVDMPLNSSPVTTTARAFDEKITASVDKLRMTTKLHGNCGFWGGIVPGNEKEIEPLIEKGVLGFKAFLTHSGIDDFPNVKESDLQIAMPIIAKHKLPLLVHCELTSEILNSKFRIQNNSYQDYLNSRPTKWEDDAIALMIRLCEEFNCRVHIVHLSSANSIEQIRKAKEKGLPLTVESAQHYLYFNAEEIQDGQTAFKCAPPIRGKHNNEQLWQALKEDVIDFVATDHSPSIPDLKELRTGDFMKAWGGIASIQFALLALWTAGRKRACSLSDITKWLCSNPSMLIGKEKTKGKIAKGYDADLIVWDPEKSFTVTESIIQHKHKITPYLNKELYGVVEEVFLKGQKVLENGKIIQVNKGTIINRDK
jgi:allantoinase